MRSLIKFLDKFEDSVRGHLSRTPLIYAMIGGVGIVLFWRGVWHTADDFGLSSTGSLVISVVILLATGLFVSFFIGEEIILTGIKREKKLAERTESEIRTEGNRLGEIKSEIEVELEDIRSIKNDLSALRREISEIKNRLPGSR